MGKFKIALPLVLLFCSFAVTANADTTFRWTTAGTFTDVTGKLTFDGVPNLWTLGITPWAEIPEGGSAEIYLGSFELDNTKNDEDGTFTLSVNFSRPPGAEDPYYPDMPVTVDANYQWWVEDRATIDFDNAVKHLTWDGGSFDFNIVEDAITVDSFNLLPTALHGQISNVRTSVPEPAAIVLLGAMVLGLGFWRRSIA